MIQSLLSRNRLSRHRMKLPSKVSMVKLVSGLATVGAIFISLMPSPAGVARPVVFWQSGCPACRASDRQVAPTYGETEVDLRAPLRCVDILRPLLTVLSFLWQARMTPVSVSVDRGHEIGRIFGYTGAERFWIQRSILVGKLNASEADEDSAHVFCKGHHVRARLTVSRLPADS